MSEASLEGGRLTAAGAGIASPREREVVVAGADRMAVVACHRGDYSIARFLRALSDEMSGDLPAPRTVPAREAVDLLLEWIAGRWDGLESRARAQAEGMAASPGWSAHGSLVVGRLLLARGRTLDAQRWLRLATERGGRGGMTPVVVSAAAGLARMRLERGDHAAAHARAAAAIDAATENGVGAWAVEAMTVAVDAAIADGRHRAAAVLIERFATATQACPAPVAEAALRFCGGSLAGAAGCHEEAAAAFETARLLFEELPCPYEAAQAQERRALSLLKLGSGEGADQLCTAFHGYARLGASADLTRVREALGRHSIAPPGPRRGGRRGRRGYGSALSPREEEVARLAADGRTNAEIAEALVLSPRTIEHQLAAAMGKLGVRSRRKLAGIADRFNGALPR